MAVSTPICSNAPTFEEMLEKQEENSIINLSLNKQLWYDAGNPFYLPPSIFCNVFRLTKDMVRHIIDVIKMREPTSDTFGMSIERQVLTTLLVYANGEYQQWGEEGLESSLSQATINSIVKHITMAISNHMLHWIKFPSSSVERIEAKNSFEKSENPFPGAFGVMDNFHVRITEPSSQPTSFWNPNFKFHSLNVQLVCGSDLKILYVNPRFPGASHDNVIWQASSAHGNMSAAFTEGERNTWLLGDGNYALQPWLMTPIPPHLADPGTPEERYNTAHSKALSTIDKCVRALRGTWRILSQGKAIDHDPVVVANMVNVCCTLHNMRCSANAPPIMETPKKKYKPQQKKRRRENSLENIAIASADGQERFRILHDPSDLSAESQLRVEAARLENQGLLQINPVPEVPRGVLSNLEPNGRGWMAAREILANKETLEDPAAAEFNPTAGRRDELDLARRIQARLVAKYFSK